MRNFFIKLRASFFQWLSTGFMIVLLYSCGSFHYAPSRIENVLAVTSSGDTVQVPLSQIRDNYGLRSFKNWQFYYESDWYYWNSFNNYRPYVRHKVNQRIRILQNTQPQRPRYRVATPRRSRPNYVQPQRSQIRGSRPTRAERTPNVVRRNNVGKSFSGG